MIGLLDVNIWFSFYMALLVVCCIQFVSTFTINLRFCPESAAMSRPSNIRHPQTFVIRINDQLLKTFCVND